MIIELSMKTWFVCIWNVECNILDTEPQEIHIIEPEKSFKKENETDNGWLKFCHIKMIEISLYWYEERVNVDFTRYKLIRAIHDVSE